MATADGFHVAAVHEHMADTPDSIYASMSPEMRNANAALIAAAPDLYAALEPLLMRWADPLSIQEHHWNAARDALKKARGKTWP